MFIFFCNEKCLLLGVRMSLGLPDTRLTCPRRLLSLHEFCCRVPGFCFLVPQTWMMMLPCRVLTKLQYMCQLFSSSSINSSLNVTLTSSEDGVGRSCDVPAHQPSVFSARYPWFLFVLQDGVLSRVTI